MWAALIPALASFMSNRAMGQQQGGAMPQTGMQSPMGGGFNSPLGGFSGSYGQGLPGMPSPGSMVNFLGQLGWKNPYTAMGKELGQIPGILQSTFNPYIKAGLGALPEMQKQYGELTEQPGQKMAEFGAGFQQSPGYQFQTKQAIDAANRAAAAGGMVGSPAEQQQTAEIGSQLANQDYYNYINHVMNLYQQGLGGLGGLYQTGYGASSQLAEDMASAMEMMAQQRAAETAAQGQHRAGLFGTIGSWL